jgi:uncharacterized protein YndB with AHSA1/START domain
VTESFTISTLIPGTPLRIYEAWLDGREHGAFTGSKAEIEPGVGGAFTAWDGYIRGRTLELAEGRRILQSWRTTEFPIGSEDSLLELTFDQAPGGTRVTLRHSSIPEGQAASYREGWGEHYFDPMKRYFGRVGPKATSSKGAVRAKPKAKPKAKRAGKKATRPAAKRARPSSRKPAKRTARRPARRR